MKTKKKSQTNIIDIFFNCLWYSFLAIVFIISCSVGIYSCNKGTNPKDYKNICIEGHIYHMVNFGQKMAIAIKLDDNGKPILCK